MNVVVAPILPEKLERWNEIANSLLTSRRAEWEDYLRRYGLTRHVAFLSQGPHGAQAVLFMEGPGAATLMPRFAVSNHPFDEQFRRELAECHGIDFSAPPPGLPPQLKGDIRV